MKRSMLLIFLLPLTFSDNLIASNRNSQKNTAAVNLLNKQGFAIRMTDPNQSIADATKALAIAKGEKYQSGIEESLRIIGIGYYYLNQPAKALTEYKESLKYAIQNNDKDAQAKVYNNIGNLYHETEYDKALSYFRKALSILLTLNDYSTVARVDQNIGTVYYNKGNYYLAEKFYKKSVKILSVLNDPINSVTANGNLGIIYFKLKQFKKAKAFLLTAKKEAGKNNLSESTANTNLSLSIVYIKQNNLTKAFKYLKEGLLLSLVIKDKKLEVQIKKELYDVQNICKGTSSRLFGEINDILLYAQLNDKLSEAERSKFEEIQFLHNANETFIKEKERNKSEILAKNKVIELQYIIGGCIVICLSIFFLLGYVFYRQYRLNKALELEKMRMNIAADFHDELGSTLSSIALFCEIAAADDFEDKQRAKILLSSISQSSLRTVSAMKDMIWSLQSNNDNTTEVIYRMRDYALPLAELKGVDLKFDVSDEIKDLALSMNIKKNIYLIFKESINNAFKYSFAQKITILMSNRNNQLELRINDDGSGFNLQDTQKGYGILNMYKRAEQCGGILKISSRIGEGTNILFNCQLV